MTGLRVEAGERVVGVLSEGRAALAEDSTQVERARQHVREMEKNDVIGIGYLLWWLCTWIGLL